jgi:hypothetical protein
MLSGSKFDKVKSRSKIYFDYAEQQGGKDREAGLKRKTGNPLTAHQWCVFVHFKHFLAHFCLIYATNNVPLHPISIKNG